MSHTNSTTNYNLPQFISTDKPAWLTDINGAFSAIDTAVKNAADDASSASTDAGQAIIDAGAASTAASGADAKASGALSSLAPAFDPASTYALGDIVIYNNLAYICISPVNTPGAWTGVTNWNRTSMKNLNSSIKSDISTINSALSDKQNKINIIIPTVKTYNAGTSLSYTGYGVECPIGHTYIVRAKFTYKTSIPVQVAASDSTANANIYHCYANSTESSTLTFTLQGGETAHYYAKYQAGGSEDIESFIIDIS